MVQHSKKREKRLVRSNSRDAILIVDVQAGFSPPTRLADQIESYSLNFGQRIFTQFVNPLGSLFRQRLNFHSMAPGSAETRLLIPTRKSDLVLQKESYGLSADHLLKIRKLEFREVIVCGVE